MALRDAADIRRHRRGEKRDLLLGRRLRKDRLHRIGKSHRQHFVGFVQHDRADAVELERASLEVIDDASRCPDDDLRPALQCVELRHVALAAIDRQHMEAVESRSVFLEGFGNLDGQLPRRHQHQCLGRMPLELQLRKDGQRKGGRLAGARLGLPEDVCPLQHRGDGGRLDRRGRFIADGLDGPEHGLGKAEIGKRDGFGFGSGFHARECTLPP